MSSRSIGVMKVRSMPRRISWEISSHSCSSRLTWSATVAAEACPSKNRARIFAASWMRTASSVNRSKYSLVFGQEVQHAALPGKAAPSYRNDFRLLYAAPLRRLQATDGNRTWNLLP